MRDHSSYSASSPQLTPHIQKEQGTLQERVSALELKCTELQNSNRDFTESREREISSARSAEATFQQQLFAEEKKSLEVSLTEAQNSLGESRKKVEDLTTEVEELQQEVAVMKAVPQPPPSPPKDVVGDSDIVVALRADNARLQGEKEELVHKFNTTEDRYKSGALVRFLCFHSCLTSVD